ncbi:DNA-binding transcription factor [Lithospermum erythrorhizon]|uniref:DNA-binding transcription factor n=1 Tax=Lithospermum erythrorhizon TaxID=34254 RepID=A0AAV3R042_LITER
MKDFVRKCSHCGHNGHNSRTCNGKGSIKLFGVKIDSHQIDDKSMRRSKSLGSLPSCIGESKEAADYYLSDSPDAHDRRKGKPWTEDEHRSFLIGLENLGKGDWRGISKTYVPTRTPTQVASHAQKYFLRISTLEGKKRRSSVFDISITEDVEPTPPNEPSLNQSGAESTIDFLSTMQEEELKKSGETSTSVVPSSERPPLSPSMRYNGSFSYPKMQYMVGPSSNARPSFSFIPMNIPGAWPPPNFVYQPVQPFTYNNMKRSPYARPLMVLPPPGGSALPHPHQVVPQPATAKPINKNDGVDLSVGALTL